MAVLLQVLLQADIYEQILIRLDVVDLIRCKSVCKPWYFLISDTRFIKSHLSHSYNNDHHHHNNNEKIKILHRRVIMSSLPVSQFQFGYGTWFPNQPNPCFLFGSSNGLICVAVSGTHLLLANPLTRQVKKLGNLPQCRNRATNSDYAESLLCWGFGYDPVMDDYKVIVGFMKSECVTSFHVLSLKSSVWKVVGEVEYTHFSSIGVLCKRALHWLMRDRGANKVILSFDLSENKFKEIPQPDNDVTYNKTFMGLRNRPILGTIEECLCIFDQKKPPKNIWKMNNYNVKRSWETVGYDDWENKNDDVHWLRLLKQGIPYDKSLCHDIHLCRTMEIMGAPIFVQSLVSPHVYDHGKQEKDAVKE